jgi:site-specific DNA-cytosine methylase
MWKHMARIIGEVRPNYAFIENSPMLTIRGLESVLADLASMGFDAEWGVLGADFIGLPHRRERIWVLATDPSNKYVERSSKQEILGKPRLQGIVYNGVDKNEQGLRSILSSGLCRTFNGLPGQVDRIKAIGNAQVPRVAAVAFNLLKERLDKWLKVGETKDFIIDVPVSYLFNKYTNKEKERLNKEASICEAVANFSEKIGKPNIVYPLLPPSSVTLDGLSTDDLLAKMQGAYQKVLNSNIRLN